LFSHQAATRFPQAAAPHLVSEVHSAFGRMTQDENDASHPAFSANEDELANLEPTYSRLNQRRIIEILVAYVPEETYHMAAQRVNQYFGADFLAVFGGFKAYVCFSQFTLGYRRKYIDVTSTKDLIDGQKKEQAVMRTMDP